MSSRTDEMGTTDSEVTGYRGQGASLILGVYKTYGKIKQHRGCLAQSRSSSTGTGITHL